MICAAIPHNYAANNRILRLFNITTIPTTHVKLLHQSTNYIFLILHLLLDLNITLRVRKAGILSNL